MSHNKDSTIEGFVEESLPNSLFRVAYKDKDGGDLSVLCYLAGKIRHHRIKVLPGDNVRFVLDPHGGKTTNRIIERIDREDI